MIARLEDIDSGPFIHGGAGFFSWYVTNLQQTLMVDTFRKEESHGYRRDLVGDPG